MKSIKQYIYLLCYLFLALVSWQSQAKDWAVSSRQNLQRVLDQTQTGDRVLLSAGVYAGNFVINHGIELIGVEGSKVDAQGRGHAIELHAEGITIRNLQIINWGDDLTDQNSGIYSERDSNRIVLENNYLEGSGFGIWLQRGSDSSIINNRVIGNSELRSSDRGNGIQLSSMKDSLVRGNEVSGTRDGLYVINSQGNLLERNTMHHLRYGIHYMYSYRNKILNNYAYSTRAGYAMMNSRHLEIRGNVTENSEDYGFLLNYIIYSTIDNNVIRNVWTKPENKVLGRDGKALFIYNAGYNTISNNYIERAEIGIHLTAGSENVKVFGNSFIENPVQVKYVSNQKQEWSVEGKGNYWSNYRGWDVNGDGFGDVAFEPNDGIDKLFWKYPEAKMLMDSPAVLLLRWVQQQFPVLKASGVKDSHPMMKPGSSDTFLSEQEISNLSEYVLVGGVQ
jgi:nitrous oxidase accessory protein